MTRIRSRTWTRVFGPMSLVVGLAGCIAGPGYGGGSAYEGGEVGYGVDFYEPYGYEYGGWHSGYRVGPPRGGEGRGERHEGDRYADDHRDTGHRDDRHDADRHDSPAGRPYRSAATSRPAPSIPTRPRGGRSGDDHRRGH